MIDNVEKYHSQLYIILGISCFFIFLSTDKAVFSIYLVPLFRYIDPYGADELKTHKLTNQFL